MKRTRSDSDCACKLCLFDQSQKLKQQQQQQHKKKAAGPFSCARRENLPRQYRKYICIVLCWHFCETHAVFTTFPCLWLRF